MQTLVANYWSFKKSVNRIGLIPTIKMISRKSRKYRTEIRFPRNEQNFFFKVLKELAIQPVYILTLDIEFIVEIPEFLKEDYFFDEDIEEDYFTKKLYFNSFNELRDIRPGLPLPWIFKNKLYNLVLHEIGLISANLRLQPIDLGKVVLNLRQYYRLLKTPVITSSRSLYFILKYEGILSKIKRIMPPQSELQIEAYATLSE